MSTNPAILINPFEAKRFINFSVVGNGIALSVSSTSSNIQLPSLSKGSPATDILIVNAGSNAAFYTIGSSNAAAAVIPTGTAANGIIILPNNGSIFYIGDQAGGIQNNWLAAITASSTTTLYAYLGYGS